MNVTIDECGRDTERSTERRADADGERIAIDAPGGGLE